MKLTEDLNNIFRQLIGKKFKLNDFSNSLEVSSEELIELLFELQDDEYLSFVPFPDGTIRFSKVGDLIAKGDISTAELYKFPSDHKLSKLVVFSLSLDLTLRIEFDKCMAHSHFVDKFKQMDENELLIFLRNRAEFFANDNQEILNEKKIEIEKLSTAQLDNDEIIHLTPEEKSKIAKAQEKHLKKNNQTVIKTEQNFKVAIEQKLELERKRNYLVTGYSETNQEKYQRLAKARKNTEQLNRDKFKAKIEERKKYVDNYYVGQVVSGKIVKKIPIGIYVDLGDSDGFISITNLDSLIMRKYSSKFWVGNTIKCEITFIDIKRGNIDIIPTSKKISTQKKLNKNKTVKKVINKSILENKKNENEKIKKTLEAILDAGGKESLQFFARLIKKNIKDNPYEWSVSLPKNKKNTVRLNNFGLEGSYINEQGIMIVVINSKFKNYELDYLIDKFVPAKNRQGKYSKLPMAIPLFIDFKNLKGKKTVIYSAYVDFFDQAKKTGKNSWKKAHEADFIIELAKTLNVELGQPDYI